MSLSSVFVESDVRKSFSLWFLPGDACSELNCKFEFIMSHIFILSLNLVLLKI